MPALACAVLASDPALAAAAPVQPSCFLAIIRRHAAGEVAVLADLYAHGHADLAFDLLCEWLRKRQGR